MDCVEVRDLLPEHALGVAGARDAAAIERHVGVCAACRKEARDLGRAVTTLAFTLAPAQPDPGLEDGVIRRIAEASGASVSLGPARRRRRRPVAVLLAAALALSAFGGAVWATREQRTPSSSREEAARKQEALGEFGRFFEGTEFTDPDARAYLGLLAPSRGSEGSGSALSITSPSLEDRAIVIVNGLVVRPRQFPLVVSLQDARGQIAILGRVSVLDSGGGATVARVTARDLTGFLDVIVRDAQGRTILRGTLAAQTPVASPAP